MTEESQEFDPYAAVLKDLKAKRAQIDQAIQVIEGLRGGISIPGISSPSQRGPGDEVDGPGAFLGMTIVDATKKLLRARKRKMNNAEIVAALKAGGMAMESADPINTVGSVLTRRFNKEGDIVRVDRGTWGLIEWYPGRNFKKKGAQASKDDNEPDQDIEAATSETSEPE